MRKSDVLTLQTDLVKIHVKITRGPHHGSISETTILKSSNLNLYNAASMSEGPGLSSAAASCSASCSHVSARVAATPIP